MNFNLIESKEHSLDLVKELRRINRQYIMKNDMTSFFKAKGLLTDEVLLFLNECSISDLIALKLDQIMSLTKGKIYPVLLSDVLKLVKLGYLKHVQKNNKYGINQHVVNESYKQNWKMKKRDEKYREQESKKDNVGIE